MATRQYEQNGLRRQDRWGASRGGARGQLSYTILPPPHRNQIRDELERMERPNQASQERRKEGIQSPSISSPRASQPRKGEQDEDE